MQLITTRMGMDIKVVIILRTDTPQNGSKSTAVEKAGVYLGTSLLSAKPTRFVDGIRPAT